MQPTNLNDYYKSIGQALPSVQDRASQAASFGIQGTYTGTAQQNQQFLQGLLNKAKTSASNPIPVAQIAAAQQPNNAQQPTGSTQPMNPVQLPTTNISQPMQQPDYASQILQNITQKETELQKQYGSIANKIASLVPELGGEKQMLAEEQQNAGVFKLKQDLQNINNQILYKTAELNKDDITLANSLQQIEDKPIAMEFITGQQASVQRNAQLQRAMKSAEIGMLNAQALASQGNIQLAMQTAQNAVDAKYTPIKETLDLYQRQLQALEPLLNREEKKLAEERDLKVKLALSDLDYRRQNESDIQKLIINAVGQQTSDNRIPADALAKAQKAKTPQEAAIALGQWAGDYWQTEKFKMDMAAAKRKNINENGYATDIIGLRSLTNEQVSLEQFKNAIAANESGGQANPYSAISPVNRNGQRAYGKYQILEGNIPSWSKEALGKTVSLTEFNQSPEIQEQIANYMFDKYYKKYGNWDDVAAVWFSGRPLSGNNSSDVTGTTVPTYVQRMRKNLGVISGGAGSSQTYSSEVLGYVEQIQAGKIKLTNVPQNIRGKVASAMSESEANDPIKKAQIDVAREGVKKLNDALAGIGGFAGVGGANIAGSNWFGRTDISNMFTGDKNVVLGYIDNMLSESTLNQLIKAKEAGATFGALSNQELGLLERSATVLNKWAIRDDVSGKLEGFSVPDEVVVAELKKMRDKFQAAIPAESQTQPSSLDNFYNTVDSSFGTSGSTVPLSAYSQSYTR